MMSILHVLLIAILLRRFEAESASARRRGGRKSPHKQHKNEDKHFGSSSTSRQSGDRASAVPKDSQFVNLHFTSEQEAQHAGIEFTPLRIVDEFRRSRFRFVARGGGTKSSFKEKHSAVLQFCIQRGRMKRSKRCTLKEYYAILNYMRSPAKNTTTTDSAPGSIGLDASRLHADVPLRCEYLRKAPTNEEFLDRVANNRPFVVRGIAKDWGAIKMWSLQYLLEKLGDYRVSVGISQDGDFVTPESPAAWGVEGAHRDGRTVLCREPSKLMTFDRFVRSGLPQNNRDNVSFYIEYFPISLLKKIAKKDLKSLRWSRVLDPTMQLLWMGVGGPRKNSRLHFDAYENIMVVAAGTKTFRLFDPSQSANVYGDTLMRSATIQAEYRVEEVNYTCPIKSHDNCWIEPGVGKYIFSRPPEAVDPHLYSHTYSPVDISRPDYVQFPKLKEARSFNCTIRAGDALYIPSYWWHEVLTYDDEEHKSIGINYFFDPYYQRSRKGDATYLTRSAVYEHFRNQLGDAKGGSVVPCESKYMCLAKGINTDDKDEVSGTASGSSGQSKKKSGPKVKRKVEAIRDKRGSRKKATSEL